MAGTTARARPAPETMLGSGRTRRGAERHKCSSAGATRFRARQIDALLLLVVVVFCVGGGLFRGEGLSKKGAGGGASLVKNQALRRPNHRPSTTHMHCPSWVTGARAGGVGVSVGLAAGGDDDDEGHLAPLPSSGGGGAPRGADEARTKRGGGCESRSRSAMGDQGGAATASDDEPFARLPGEQAHARAPMPLATQTSAGAGTATAMAGTSGAGTGCAEWQGAAAHGSNPQPTDAATSSTTKTRAAPTRRRSGDATERNI